MINRILLYFFLEDKILPRNLYFNAVTKKERNFGLDEHTTTSFAYTTLYWISYNLRDTRMSQA